MRHRQRFRLATMVCGALATALLCAPVFAQDEASLRSVFEGRRVTVKMDMPATSDGVDVHIGAAHPIDYQQYVERIKEYGISLPGGASTTVTRVKVKRSLIEVQLGGGGFGTFSDEWSAGGSTYVPFIEKSTREKELEQAIREEPDSRRRRELEWERDEVQEARDRENRRIAIKRAELDERKREQIARRRLMDGSRFNLRYPGTVPLDITADQIAAALGAYVDFSGAGFVEAYNPRPVGPPIGAPPPGMPSTPALQPADTILRKGMTRLEAERELGSPADVSDRREGGLSVTSLVFVRGDERITADFVSDVLVRYTVASK